MARALHAWAINRGGKNSVCNLRYSCRTRLVRGISVKTVTSLLQSAPCWISSSYSLKTKYFLYNTIGQLLPIFPPSISLTTIFTSSSQVTEKSKDSIEEMSIPPFSCSFFISLCSWKRITITVITSFYKYQIALPSCFAKQINPPPPLPPPKKKITAIHGFICRLLPWKCEVLWQPPRVTIQASFVAW